MKPLTLLFKALKAMLKVARTLLLGLLALSVTPYLICYS